MYGSMSRGPPSASDQMFRFQSGPPPFFTAQCWRLCVVLGHEIPVCQLRAGVLVHLHENVEMTLRPHPLQRTAEAGRDEVLSEVHPMDVDCIWFANTSEVHQFVLGEVVALRGFDKPGNQGGYEGGMSEGIRE